MRIPHISEDHEFPAHDVTDEDDVWARSKSLSPTLMYRAAVEAGAYTMGRTDSTRKGWDWCIPSERAVFFLDDVVMTTTTRQQMTKAKWRILFNPADFDAVVDLCAEAVRDEEEVGDDEEYIEWLDVEARTAYKQLAKDGCAWCVSVRSPGSAEIVGGIFGIWSSHYITLESMFFKESGASKAALLHLIHTLRQLDPAVVYTIDAQEWSEHLGSLGAQKFTRAEFEEHKWGLMDKSGGTKVDPREVMCYDESDRLAAHFRAEQLATQNGGSNV